MTTILEYLTDDLTAHILHFAGSHGTAKCAKTCRQWHRVAHDSRSLWREFVRDEFRLQQAQANDPNSAQVDWRQVHDYLASSQQRLRRSGNPLRPLSARVLFADDGSPVPGYPPENATIRDANTYTAWCTNAGVDHDVDLVLELPQPCLIAAFEVANGGFFYSAPLKEALVFCSSRNEPIDLERARKFNGKAGSKRVQQMVTKESDGRVMTKINNNPDEPVAAFYFSNYEEATMARERKAIEPNMIVAKYIHFKLLSSYNCPHGRESDNIDVLDLLTFGTKLPRLNALLQERTYMMDDDRPDPSYQRLHPIREYIEPDEEW